jgi:hypothetical protein
MRQGKQKRGYQRLSEDEKRRLMQDSQEEGVVSTEDKGMEVNGCTLCSQRCCHNECCHNTVPAHDS